MGANIGFYSILMGSEFSWLEVFSFEPMSAAFEDLQENLRFNDLDKRVQPERIALSDKAGRAEIGVVGELSGANSIIETSIHREKPKERVEVVNTSTLDELLRFRRKVLCAKIDVEGHEKRGNFGRAKVVRK